MADETGTGRGKLIALVLGLVLLGGSLAACSDDGDSASTARSSEATTDSSPASTAPPTASTSADPPCTNAAILAAVKVSDPTATSVSGFQCGNGWAGTGFANAEFDAAALLRAENGTWVVVDRAQYCDDPSIPADVHIFCTVS
jgi:hypothetical protein